jgi:hypothetical protein
MSFDPRDPPDPYEDRSRRNSGQERSPHDAAAGSHDPYDYTDGLDNPDRSSERQRQTARGLVTGPAFILLVVASFNLVTGAGGLYLGNNLLHIPAETVDQLKQQKAKEVNEIKKIGINFEDLLFWETWGLVGTGVVSLIFALIIFAGGACMLGLKAWPLNVLAALVALISPGGCCVFGLAGGIWALVVLFNPVVRAGYR